MKRKFIGSIIAALSLIFTYTSCSKIDTTDLGSDLIPAVDNVNTFDTVLKVISNNVRANDTLKMLYTELHTAGMIENDPEFGQTTTYFYTSFVPSTSHSYPFIKRDTVRIDSVVLSLSYGGLYGDSNSIETFEVREINHLFNFRDTGYRVDIADIPVKADLLGSQTVSFYTLNDSVFYRNPKDTARSASELRIKLDTGWARQFVNYDTTAGSAYNNDSIFKTRFRGLEIRPSDASAVKRGLAYFNLGDNSKTKITFYCRVQNNGRTDTIAPYFIYRSGGPEANIVRRTPANGYLANLDNNVENDDLVYLQTTPGSNVTLQIPDLSSLDNRVIHRAELIMEKAPSSDESDFTPPPSLFIEAQNPQGDSVFTIRNDFILTNSNPGYDVNVLGGQLKNNKYVFNLSRYVQSIVTKGYRNYTLRVSAPFAVTPYFLSANDVPTAIKIPIVINGKLAGGRVVLYGGNYADINKQMRLHIIYSKIKS